MNVFNREYDDEIEITRLLVLQMLEEKLTTRMVRKPRKRRKFRLTTSLLLRQMHFLTTHSTLYSLTRKNSWLLKRKDLDSQKKGCPEFMNIQTFYFDILSTSMSPLNLLARFFKEFLRYIISIQNLKTKIFINYIYMKFKI